MADPHRPRVLVIDDEADWRYTIRSMLQQEGWDVVEADDGAAALERLRDMDGPAPDAIICDIRIPGRMGGIEFFSRLLSARPKIFPRLILYSSAIEHESVQAFLAHTPIRALSKSDGADALTDAVEQAISAPADEAHPAYAG